MNNGSKLKEQRGNLVAAKGNVGSVNEAVPLDRILGREIGDIAVVDGGLVSAQVKIVSETEQEVGCRHARFFFSD